MSAPSIPPLPACMSEIRRKRFEYEGRFGRAPEAIYLGSQDEKELCRYMEHFAGHLLGRVPGLKMFDGIAVYRVEAVRHVGVGS